MKVRWKGIPGPKYLFVDEIQEIEFWEKAIASLLGQKEAVIYVTGSNAHLLSSELATLLSGRYVEFPVLPLTFSEFREFRKNKATAGTLEEDFNLYLKYGGLPGLHEFPFSDEVVFQYLNAVFTTILHKAITVRHGIRDAAMLDRIARFAFDNCGNRTWSWSTAAIRFRWANWERGKSISWPRSTGKGCTSRSATTWPMREPRKGNSRPWRRLPTTIRSSSSP